MCRGYSERMRRCEQLLQYFTMKLPECAKPLDPVLYSETSDYFDTVTRPIYLSTISRKLRVLAYPSAVEFADDMNTMLSNFEALVPLPIYRKMCVRARALAIRPRQASLKAAARGPGERVDRGFQGYDGGLDHDHPRKRWAACVCVVACVAACARR